MAEATTTRAGTPVGSGPRYVNRELSWLDFNARVLALAATDETPAAERARFCGIFSNNLDEFFQVRVAALKEKLASDIEDVGPDGLDTVEMLAAVHRRTTELVSEQTRIWAKEIAPALEDAGSTIVRLADLADADRAHIGAIFAEHIYPVLTPLAVDPAHPFPYISNLSLNLAVVVRDPNSLEERFARVKVPPLLDRFVALADRRRFIPVEDVIAAHVEQLFPGMDVVEHHAFRVTRDVEIELSDESEDLLQAIELVLQRRTRFGRAVRLEIDSRASEATVALLMRELELDPYDVFPIEGLLDLSTVFEIVPARRHDLAYPSYTPQTPVAFSGGAEHLFDAIRVHDVLVHHPYESFVGTVEAFVAAAAADPDVLAIKQTLYRTSGDEEGIVASLVAAAGSGKQVVALVELKARFDEQRNIERARMLEESGVHVVYGLVGLKTHAKILLVVRREGGGLRRYCHIGTGNYNPKTSAIYEDVGLFSADEQLTSDVAELFNYLTGYSRPRAFQRLLVAPDSLRDGLMERIAAQARPGGRIVMKMNALVDPELIDALYDAGRKGADIDLVVRGVCCLLPGIPGHSDRIRVRSILGRYLEHSRIYRFGDDEDAEYLIGSADLMPRNLDRRVESLVIVTDDSLRARLAEILTVNLHDDQQAWSLEPDGTWLKPAANPDGHGTHVELERRTRERVRVATTLADPDTMTVH